MMYAGLGALFLYIITRVGEKIIVSAETKKNFINTMAPIASAIEKDFGIRPLITMAQSALESGWGVSGLTVQANNLFGFTKGSWTGDVIYLPTREYRDGKWVVENRAFRKYKSWYDSVKNWAEIISGLSRYASAYRYAKAGDVQGFASAVAQGGYATDPGYAGKVVAFANAVRETPLGQYADIPEGSKKIKFEG